MARERHATSRGDRSHSPPRRHIAPETGTAADAGPGAGGDEGYEQQVNCDAHGGETFDREVILTRLVSIAMIRVDPDISGSWSALNICA